MPAPTDGRPDPRTMFPGPDQPGQQVEHPGRTHELDPPPDHGEHSYRGCGKLDGAVSLITGGDSGIGRAIALAFAREGADVVLTCLAAEEDDANATAEYVRTEGREAVVLVADLSEQTGCQRVIEETARRFGRIDVLVSNAAYQMSKDDGLAGIAPEQFDHTLRTNVYALYWLCRAALPHLPPGASVITTSSIQGFQPSPHLLDYATSKGAIVNLTKALAADLIERGIRVNSVAPGPVWTPLIPATMPEDKVASFGTQSPMGRAAQPAELASAFVFLASTDSSYVTGEVIAVTGGSPIV
ncbi:MAG TPA: SDR family oxidoreductase [Acidimicrobiales bacterium]|nr:SDR family oxidoreductase [Acidimicrobiales bacterium]